MCLWSQVLTEVGYKKAIGSTKLNFSYSKVKLMRSDKISKLRYRMNASDTSLSFFWGGGGIL